ncbi:MAG TPA: urease accessory UreF family protein [Stellaceae bacterium]
MSADARERAVLYRLLAWLSPSFPTGAFSYSHGLEAAVASGAIHDRASLQSWIAAIVGRGSGRIDADILRDAYRAARTGDNAALDAASRRGIAYRATAELALESAQQGDAFLGAWQSAWAAAANPSPPFRGERVPKGDSPKAGEVGIGRSGIPHLTPALSAPRGGEGVESGCVCLPVVFGAAAASAEIALEDALLGYLQAFAGNLVSAGLRLGIIGQTDGQRILAALEPVIIEAAEAALARDPADFGGVTFALDLASMAHETQYSRLFRS